MYSRQKLSKQVFNLYQAHCCMEWSLDRSGLLDASTKLSTTSLLSSGGWTLPLCLISSSLGMLTLKRGQVMELQYVLACGYLLEAVAFAVYPFALKVYSMRAVSTMWAASSTLTSLVGGWWFYNEVPSLTSVCGCMVVVLGVVMVVQ